MRTSIEDQQGPDAKTLAALGAIVLVGGLNFVAVRFSNRGLPPLFGAGFRFLIASLLLIGFVVVRKIPLPNRLQLKGTLIYGVLNFAISYAFAYLALVKLPSAVAAVIMGSVPLITLFLATFHGVERFRLRGLTWGCDRHRRNRSVGRRSIGSQHRSRRPFDDAGSGFRCSRVGGRRQAFPDRSPGDYERSRNAGRKRSSAGPIGRMAGAMVNAVGSGDLAGPHLPDRDGFHRLFGLYLYALKRWTASGVSYMFVLTPIVASISGAVLAGEAITPTIVFGGSIVLAGVYIGALSHHPARKAVPEPEEETSAAS